MIVIETDAQSLKCVLVEVVVFVDDVTGRNAFFFCPDSDGRSVFIGATDPYDVLAQQPLVAHEDIGGQVSPSQVTEV